MAAENLDVPELAGFFYWMLMEEPSLLHDSPEKTKFLGNATSLAIDPNDFEGMLEVIERLRRVHE